MNGYKMMRVGGVVVLAFAAVVLFQASQQSYAAPGIAADDLMGIAGGITCKCKTTSSCDTLKRAQKGSDGQWSICYYCNGSSTDPWCTDHASKNCSTSGSFSCGRKYRCEDAYCTVLCGDQGDCSFSKATADSDDC